MPPRRWSQCSAMSCSSAAQASCSESPIPQRQLDGRPRMSMSWSRSPRALRSTLSRSGCDRWVSRTYHDAVSPAEGARSPRARAPQTLNQLRRLRANRAQVHVPLRRLRASSCGLAGTANLGSYWPDLLQTSGIQPKTEGERFELSVRQSGAQRFSRPPHSTTLPPLQVEIPRLDHPAVSARREAKGLSRACSGHLLSDGDASPSSSSR